MRHTRSCLFALLICSSAAIAQPYQTDWLTSVVFGALWRGNHTAEVGDSSYVEPSLRPFLPSRAFEDLAYARHPKGAELVHALAVRAGLVMPWSPEPDGSISSDSLLLLLGTDATQKADVFSYCKLRLFDRLVGDWSRTPEDVRWMPEGSGGDISWRPLPAPHRNAFTRYDGLLPSILLLLSEYMSTWSAYPGSSVNASHPLRFLDRRLLSSAPWSVWDSAGRSLSSDLHPDLLDTLGGRILGNSGDQLLTQLKQRSESMSDLTRELHRIMSQFVEIHPDGPADSVHVRVLSDRAIEVRSGSRTESPQIISAIATQEVRFLLSRGRHTLWIEGPDELSFDLIAELGQKGSSVWNRRSPRDAWSEGPPSRIEVYRTPRQDLEIERDDAWGHRTTLVPWIDANEDDWIFLGSGISFTTSAYRTQPFGTRLGLWAGYATRTRRIRARGSFESRGLLRNFSLGIQAQYSRLDIANFYGLGNETTASDHLLSLSYFKTDQRTVKLGPFIRYSPGPALSIGLYPTLHSIKTDPRPGSLIDSLIATGYPAALDYGSVTIDARYDSRDRTFIPTRGMFASAAVSWFPGTTQNIRSFLRFMANVKYYQYMGDEGMHLLLQTTGTYLAGSHPWFESAFIGGSETLRGYRRQRFAGDAAISGTVEMRIPIGRLHLLWPLDFGAILFTDTGRIFLDGERSSVWHSSGGVGFWVHPALWPFNIAVSLAASNERFEFLATFGESVIQ